MPADYMYGIVERAGVTCKVEGLGIARQKAEANSAALEQFSKSMTAKELRSVVMAERLLARPSDVSMQIYYDKLSASARGHGLRVQQIGGALGKGLFADREYEGDDLVLREPKLVGAQHTQNKADALVCSFCFRYIGSIELQIGQRLLSVEDECLPGASQQHDQLHGSPSGIERREYGSGFVHGRSEASQMDVDQTGEQAREEGCVCEDVSEVKTPLSAHLVESLLKGDLLLPESELFPLPQIVNCPGACSEDWFCSDACAADAWNAYHSLLCTGEGSLCHDKNSLVKFKKFADDTNDIFHIAAQVLSGTILQVRRLNKEKSDSQNSRKLTPEKIEKEEDDILLQAWEPFAMGHKKLWWEAVALPPDIGPEEETSFRDQMKDLASKSLMHLKGAIYEEEFSACIHLKGLHDQTNLGRKEEGLPDHVLFLVLVCETCNFHCSWLFFIFSPGPLTMLPVHELWNPTCLHIPVVTLKKIYSVFSLEVYGHIIGMFEQNNLEIVVPSPVEDYFIYIDDLPPLAKAEADLITRPFLQALGSDYATYCQGSGFFPLQSCVNHSCQPNVKAFKRDEDRDGHAVLLATRCIQKGEEITISYIDEDADLEDRQAMLADYGFACSCPKCTEESLKFKTSAS